QIDGAGYETHRPLLALEGWQEDRELPCHDLTCAGTQPCVERAGGKPAKKLAGTGEGRFTKFRRDDPRDRAVHHPFEPFELLQGLGMEVHLLKGSVHRRTDGARQGIVGTMTLRAPEGIRLRALAGLEELTQGLVRLRRCGPPGRTHGVAGRRRAFGLELYRLRMDGGGIEGRAQIRTLPLRSRTAIGHELREDPARSRNIDEARAACRRLAGECQEVDWLAPPAFEQTGVAFFGRGYERRPQSRENEPFPCAGHRNVECAHTLRRLADLALGAHRMEADARCAEETELPVPVVEDQLRLFLFAPRRSLVKVHHVHVVEVESLGPMDGENRHRVERRG